jgi:hypothetical protein
VDVANLFLANLPFYVQLAKILSRMWLSFIANLDPTEHGIESLPKWPVYDINDAHCAETIAFINSASQFGRSHRERYGFDIPEPREE